MLFFPIDVKESIAVSIPYITHTMTTSSYKFLHPLAAILFNLGQIVYTTLSFVELSTFKLNNNIKIILNYKFYNNIKIINFIII